MYAQTEYSIGARAISGQRPHCMPGSHAGEKRYGCAAVACLHCSVRASPLLWSALLPVPVVRLDQPLRPRADAPLWAGAWHAASSPAKNAASSPGMGSWKSADALYIYIYIYLLVRAQGTMNVIFMRSYTRTSRGKPFCRHCRRREGRWPARRRIYDSSAG